MAQEQVGASAPSGAGRQAMPPARRESDPIRLRRRSRHRRLLLSLLIIITVTSFLWLTAAVLFPVGITWLGVAVLIAIAIPWTVIALSFWSAVIGFFIYLFRGADSPVVMPLDDGGAQARPTGRTAVAMPVFHEDPARFLAGLEATMTSIRLTGMGERFDYFILSDTRDGADAEAEAAAVAAWRTGLPEDVAVHYRRRETNSGRKAGNVMAFCESHGDAYDYMLLLDADSIMDGAVVTRLARLMDANPQVGLIQTTPMITRAGTLFARFMQFGTRIALRPLAVGMAYWFGAESNYYGHNAIIRVAPFKAHCRLPRIRRCGHLNGEILSHDFVEAAFLRRAGLEVWLLPTPAGSYEEVPPDLPRFLKRDRRWCNGNLQHGAVLGGRGLHAVSRSHMAVGIVTYLAGPLWLFLVLAAVWRLAHPYDWVPGGVPDAALIAAKDAIELHLYLIAAVAVMLLAPRFFGAAIVLAVPHERRAMGGSAMVILGMLAEILFTALLAPIMMVTRTLDILTILLGRACRWEPQNRDGQALGFLAALRSQAAPLAVGIAVTAAILAVSPAALPWFAPVLAGLLVSPLLACWTSREGAGLVLTRLGLLRVAEERVPYHVTRLEPGLIANHRAAAPAATGGPHSAETSLVA
ncbi:MAG: glucans biosynthesis glucosyltransferase MdoH [Azospirillaceae bacterium]